MGVKRQARSLLNKFLKRFGDEIIESSIVYDWQRSPQTQPIYRKSILPEGAESFLHPNNPRLKKLQERYATFDNEVTNPFVWKEDILTPEDILYFRGDNAYVWQLRGKTMNEMGYALALLYIKSIDNLGFLEKLTEDDLFGNFTFNFDHQIISRDLLDSIIEIYFLEKHLSVSTKDNLSILDIGAGYGRLAHRMMDALPNIKSYWCTDAIATSTFICEYYLRFRNLENRAGVIPLDELEDALKKQSIDIAINIHSFSECNISAIEWWLSLLEKYGVKYLMIVPNSESLQTNDQKDFGKLIEKHGYKLIAKEQKYRLPIVQKYAINPTCHYLFKLD